jgi:16S rRNA (adenine1518-N6/adenine1519-N6)-dimethyltransferase
MEQPRAKKSLGQHFLVAHSYLRAMAEAGGVQEGDLVLEVGPGTGLLTKELLARGAKVVAIEKDARMIPLLTSTFAAEIKKKQLKIVHGDILEQNLKKLGLGAGKYKVVANIPYYISGFLFRYFLTHKEQPSSMTLLVQKEVAERIARSKKESLLSLSVKAYGKPIFVKKVPKGAFAPAPKVDSAILTIENISRQNFADAAKEALFFKLIHAGFAHKRKSLGKALTPIIGTRATAIASARAEDIPLSVWLSL